MKKLLDRHHGYRTWCPSPTKKTNDIRLAIDMRQANKAVLRERFPMPNIDETLEQMNGSTVFTRLDMNQAFHQIELVVQESKILLGTNCNRIYFMAIHFGEVSQTTY